MEWSPPPQLEDDPIALSSSQLIDELGMLVEGLAFLPTCPRFRKAISSSVKAASRCSASPARVHDSANWVYCWPWHVPSHRPLRIVWMLFYEPPIINLIYRKKVLSRWTTNWINFIKYYILINFVSVDGALKSDEYVNVPIN